MATVFTVGHSVHEPDEFLDICAHSPSKPCSWTCAATPHRSRQPHFNSGALAPTLGSAGIAYRHEDDLGGQREPAPDSPNSGWRTTQLRGYADYMGSATSRAALYQLEADMGKRPTAVMCAEADWRRCHRRLLADALRGAPARCGAPRRRGPRAARAGTVAVVAHNAVTCRSSLEV